MCNILNVAAQKINAKQPGSVRKGYILKPSSQNRREADERKLQTKQSVKLRELRPKG